MIKCLTSVAATAAGTVAALLLTSCGGSAEANLNGSTGLDGPSSHSFSKPIDIVDYCARLGAKMPGSPASREMAETIAASFRSSGLETSFEDFNLPQYRVNSVSLTLNTSPAISIPAETFSFGGTGSVTGNVEYVGVGRPEDYEGRDVKDSIIMVSRDAAFHRSAQYREAIQHGGGAMLYVSDSPDNLVQGGTARFAQDLPGTMPVVTVGADDGAKIKDIVTSQETAATIAVDAERYDAVGRNVIGRIKGTDFPDDYVVLGGHYDAWHDGAVDNCTGIASLMTVASSMAAAKPRYSVIFAAWDGEETGLTGSMDWLIKHPDIASRTAVNQNFEMTAAGPDDPSIVITTKSARLYSLLTAASLKSGFLAIYAGPKTARKMAGGVIPSDLQNFYASGIQGFSTFSKSAFYHTTEDTTKHVSSDKLDTATDFMQDAFNGIQGTSPDDWGRTEVPELQVSVPNAAQAGSPLEVKITVKSPTGESLSDEEISVVADQQGYWATFQGNATSIGAGQYRVTIPGDSVKPGELVVRVGMNTPEYSGFAARVVRVT